MTAFRFKITAVTFQKYMDMQDQSQGDRKYNKLLH